jgi:hypothetical protein
MVRVSGTFVRFHEARGLIARKVARLSRLGKTGRKQLSATRPATSEMKSGRVDVRLDVDDLR